MSIRCTVCQDPRVQTLDSLLAQGRSGRSLAAEFGLSPDAVKRHAKAHAAPRDSGRRAPSGADPLSELVDALRSRALDGNNSGTVREYRLALAALTERSAERPAYNVLADPEWLRLRDLLLEALEPYPEARLAVADALRGALR